MRILYVITSLRTGGAEKLMVDLLPRLRDLGNDVELLLFDGTSTPFYEDLRNMGITIYHLAIGGNVYNPLNIFRLRKYLKNYDIIHTHNTACQFYTPISKMLSQAKCKLFTTEHNTFNRRRNIFGWKYIDKFIYSQYKTIISISEKATSNLIAFIGNKYKIRTIENSIDLSKFKDRKELALYCHNIVEDGFKKLI
jgi:glycosyltransferase involved in cell wall biosynthesis